MKSGNKRVLVQSVVLAGIGITGLYDTDIICVCALAATSQQQTSTYQGEVLKVNFIFYPPCDVVGLIRT